MKIQMQAFSVEKSGNDPSEIEDAWAYDVEADLLAISDGASDAFDSSRWAQILTSNFVHSRPGWSSEALLAWLASPIRSWRSEIRWETLPWYSEEKARRGSFATLLAFGFDPNTIGSDPRQTTLTAIAIGDSCLFHVRSNLLLSVFPPMTLEDFGNTPALLSTDLEYSQRSLAEMKRTACNCEPGDLLLAATDAFSAWLLKQHLLGRSVWQDYAGMEPGAFRESVLSLREQGDMRNDDVTLLVVNCQPSMDC